MARADLERFPKLIIEIPESEFPDKIRIIMKGRKISKNKTAQLAFKAAAGPVYLLTIWSESNFKNKSADGKKKVVKVDMPFNEIISVSGWAQRNNFEDLTPVNVNMFTTTSSGLPSATGTTRSLDGVWSYQFTLNKQELTVDYCTTFLTDGTPVGQMTQAVATFAGQAATVVAKSLLPTPPTPKAIAAKLLGPAAIPVQTFLAVVGQQIAQMRPTITTVVAIAQAIAGIAKDPGSAKEYLPMVFSFLFEFIPKEDIAKVIYDFRGGA